MKAATEKKSRIDPSPILKAIVKAGKELDLRASFGITSNEYKNPMLVVGIDAGIDSDEHNAFHQGQALLGLLQAALHLEFAAAEVETNTALQVDGWNWMGQGTLVARLIVEPCTDTEEENTELEDAIKSLAWKINEALKSGK